MNLMSLVRLCGVVAIGWTLLAMGIGAFRADHRHTAEETNFFLPEPALHEAVAVSPFKVQGMDEYRLVDRSTGRVGPLALPEDANWGLVSVSPWRDRAGNLEAVGRWSRRADSGEEGFCGLGLFRLSDATVVHSINLDVLPTGRPCWVPGRPGDLLFPAGDGQLHHCRLARNRDRPAATPAQGEASAGFAGPGRTHPVTWRCPVPGSGSVYILDSAWPDDRQLRKFLFASLSTKVRVGGKLRADPPQIWWLEMSEAGDEILSAGRLMKPEPGSEHGVPVIEACPM